MLSLPADVESYLLFVVSGSAQEKKVWRYQRSIQKRKSKDRQYNGKTKTVFFFFAYIYASIASPRMKNPIYATYACG
jgi:hypothetical protein